MKIVHKTHAHSATVIRLAKFQRRSAAFYFREYNGAVRKKRPSDYCAEGNQVCRWVFPKQPRVS